MDDTLKRGRLHSLLLLVTLVALTACGGDGEDPTSNPPPPTAPTVTVKLATSGTPSANLGGISMTMTLPDGVTPNLNPDGSVAEPAVVVSGVAAPGTVLARIYTPASDTSNGILNFVLATSLVDGFGVGEFATVTLITAVGVNPVQTDFALTGFIPIDVNGNNASGLIAEVAEVNVQ